MKDYPSIWIIERFVNDNGKMLKKFDISAKLSATLPAVHYFKDKLEEAKKFCLERFGKYDSVRKDI